MMRFPHFLSGLAKKWLTSCLPRSKPKQELKSRDFRSEFPPSHGPIHSTRFHHPAAETRRQRPAAATAAAADAALAADVSSLRDKRGGVF